VTTDCGAPCHAGLFRALLLSWLGIAVQRTACFHWPMFPRGLSNGWNALPPASCPALCRASTSSGIGNK